MRLLAAFLVGFCCCAAAVGCAKAPAQTMALPPNKVTVSYPLRRSIADYVEFTGQTSPVKTVEVRARVWGYLKSLHFTEGSLVKQGDLLFQIDPRPIRPSSTRQREKSPKTSRSSSTTRRPTAATKNSAAQGAATQEDSRPHACRSRRDESHAANRHGRPRSEAVGFSTTRRSARPSPAA